MDPLAGKLDERLARSRPWLASFTVLIAVSAWAGAVGVMIGAVDFGETVNSRLPFHSPVLAGITLAVLIGWIAVEVGVIRIFTVLQPVGVLAGLVVLVARLKDFGRS